MGILGLAKLLHDKCPNAMREDEMKNFFGRKIAIDASMSIYQFIIAMKGFSEGQGVELTNANGEVTSHLNGLFARTIRMCEEGLKPIYVFDGAPPKMKKDTLEGRREKAAEALKEAEIAKDEGNDEAMEKFSKRTVRVSRDQVEEVKTMLRLMGVPVVQAAGEAEAQCAELVRGKLAWAVATEDMDALTFGSQILLRHLNYGESKGRSIVEIHLDKVLEASGFTMDMFIDLCILLGCDYTGKIHGIGPIKAWDGIMQYKTIENFMASLDLEKYKVPEDFDFVGARELFRNPDVKPASEIELQWKEPDAEGLRKFLVEDKLFNPERVEKGITRLKAALQQKTQGRIDSFFTVIKRPTGDANAAGAPGSRKTAASGDPKGLPAGKLRKVEAAKGGGAKKAVKK